MSKHSTTPRTLSRRLAALLAALALLAAMALPVYAEALDGTTGTAQAEIGDTISDGTVTTENDSTTPEKEAAEGSTANADGNNASENEDTKDNASPSTTGDSNTTADDAANDTPQTLPADNTAPTAADENKNNTNDTTSKDFSDNSESSDYNQLMGKPRTFLLRRSPAKKRLPSILQHLAPGATETIRCILTRKRSSTERAMQIM